MRKNQIDRMLCRESKQSRIEKQTHTNTERENGDQIQRKMLYNVEWREKY